MESQAPSTIDINAALNSLPSQAAALLQQALAAMAGPGAATENKRISRGCIQRRNKRSRLRQIIHLHMRLQNHQLKVHLT